MGRGLTEFVKTYIAISAVLLAISIVVAFVTRLSILYVVMLMFLWGGFAYLCAAILAWTGFGNLYRYSPTLFIGSRSYRKQIVSRDVWKEGRDDDALLIGLAFGAALMALGAAIWDPLFILIDALAIAGVGLLLRLHRAHSAVKS